MAAILVVDDDDDISAPLADLIRVMGHEVRTAADGLEALQRVSEHMPDIILLDIKMPRMGGQEFAQRFRDQYDGAARIVVMTAAASAAMRAQEVGADAWLAKPFDLDDLTKVLESLRRPRRRPPTAGA